MLVPLLEPVVGKDSATFCVTLPWSTVLYAYKYPLFIIPNVVGKPFIVTPFVMIELILAVLIFAVVACAVPACKKRLLRLITVTELMLAVLIFAVVVWLVPVVKVNEDNVLAVA